MFAHFRNFRRIKRPFALGMTLLLLLSSLGVAAQTTSAQIGPSQGTSGVFVKKWVCPANVPQGGTLEDYYELCSPSLAPLAFAIQSPGGTSSRVTSGGVVVWEKVPVGPIRIIEEIPPSYGDEPIVFCTRIDIEIGIRDFTTFDPRPYNPPGVIAPGGTFETKVLELSYLRCDWFNVKS